MSKRNALYKLMEKVQKEILKTIDMIRVNDVPPYDPSPRVAQC